MKPVLMLQVIKLLKSKEASNVVDIKSWPVTLDTDELPRRKLPGVYKAPTAELVAYLDFSVSTTGMLAGIKMSHSRLVVGVGWDRVVKGGGGIDWLILLIYCFSTTALCRAMKLQCELYPSRHLALCLDPYCGLGFALWCLSSVYRFVLVQCVSLVYSRSSVQFRVQVRFILLYRFVLVQFTSLQVLFSLVYRFVFAQFTGSFWFSLDFRVQVRFSLVQRFV